MKINKFILLLFLLFSLLFCSSCLFSYTSELSSETVEQSESITSSPYVQFSASPKHGVGHVENSGETQRVTVGEKVVLRANDTAEYVFSHWEYQNKIISTESEFSFSLPFSRNVYKYYAVFVPRDENFALINVIYQAGSTLTNNSLPTEIIGGYYQIGDIADLRLAENNKGIIRTFSYDSQLVDGPTLQLPVEKSLTITATLENQVYVELAKSENYTLYLDTETSFFDWQDSFRAYAEIHSYDGSQPHEWILKNAFTGEIIKSQNYYASLDTSFWTFIDSSYFDMYRHLIIELTFSYDLINTLEVEVVSATGDPVGIYVEMPNQVVAGTYGYPVKIIPDENTYVQEVYVYYGHFAIDMNSSIKSIYEGNPIRIRDDRDNFGSEGIILVKAIPREKSAIVNVISDDSYITGTPSSYYAPTISTDFLIVQKNKDYVYSNIRYNNLYSIYEVGYQLSHVEDENGNVVANSFDFTFNVDKDTNFHYKWESKPVFDTYFDYKLTEDKSGYVVKISEIAHALISTKSFSINEITLPETYNGKPVKEIADYGFSQYRIDPVSKRQRLPLPFKRIILPTTLEKIGTQAFSGTYTLHIVLPENDSLTYVSPDAFWSDRDFIQINLSGRHINLILQTLHKTYIGENANFEYLAVSDDHFDSIGEIAHYESFAEYICIRESFLLRITSSYELAILYHEFFHHYQIVAMYGVNGESYDTLNVQPSLEEVEDWMLPYNNEDYDAYWNHPMEVSARQFALNLTGYVL